MRIASKLMYAIAFQVGWFVCVMMGNWISFGYALTILALHFWSLTHKTKLYSFKKEVLWIILIFVSGFILETMSFSAGFLYTDTQVNIFQKIILPPLWLLNLWILFAIALRTCLSFVFYKPKVTYLISCLAIPFNYYTGAKLNADVVVNSPYALSLALISLLWLAFLWVLTHVKRHYFEDIFHAS